MIRLVGSMLNTTLTPLHDVLPWNTARNGGFSADSEGWAARSIGPKSAEPNNQTTFAAPSVHIVVGLGTGFCVVELLPVIWPAAGGIVTPLHRPSFWQLSNGTHFDVEHA